MRVAVAGCGVAGLSAAWHLVECWKTLPNPPKLDLYLIGQLVPDDASVGNGLAGKAMSRSFVGRIDPKSTYDRRWFYGPMMPEGGCVPHGYHILWEYPNLRRMLGDRGDGMLPADGDPDAPPRQVLVPPGGAAFLGAFQGLLDDPTPGGPGVACLGLTDVSLGEKGARTEAAKALIRLGGHPVFGLVVTKLRDLFRILFPDAGDPLEFADIVYTREFDVEMRLTLCAATLAARVTDPETATIEVDGVQRRLTDIEYDVWAEALMRDWATRMGDREGAWSRWVLAWRAWRKVRAAFTLAEGWIESNDGLGPLARAFPAVADLHLVYQETERFVRALPGAVLRLVGRSYPAWRSVHFRFAPDATFASPFSFDAASAVRSLAFCYRTPRAGRVWAVDGQRFQQLWLLLWRRLQRAAPAAGVTLHMHEGRVHALGETGGSAWLTWGTVLGHGGAPVGGPLTDLWMPHVPNIGTTMPEPADVARIDALDAVIPAFGAGLMAELVDAEPARTQLRRVANPGNETLELLLWLRHPIPYGRVAREALANGAIGGLEGPFCMIADYTCGLWSPEVYAAEDPFGDGVPFAGSLIESCGGYADLFAARTADDAFGWPEFIKEELRTLISDPQLFAATDPRPWPQNEDPAWKDRRADGTWRPEPAHDIEQFRRWIRASRWLVWGYVRQLSMIASLGTDAVHEFDRLAGRLDPRIHDPLDEADQASLGSELRYILVRNATPRNRFYNPAAGDWPHRPVSGVPLAGTTRLFPAGEWTRNGLDIICMEAACLSGMRAARSTFSLLCGASPPTVPGPIQVLPDASWYDGLDPMERRR